MSRPRPPRPPSGKGFRPLISNLPGAGLITLGSDGQIVNLGPPVAAGAPKTDVPQAQVPKKQQVQARPVAVNSQQQELPLEKQLRNQPTDWATLVKEWSTRQSLMENEPVAGQLDAAAPSLAPATLEPPMSSEALAPMTDAEATVASLVAATPKAAAAKVEAAAEAAKAATSGMVAAIQGNSPQPLPNPTSEGTWPFSFLPAQPTEPLETKAAPKKGPVPAFRSQYVRSQPFNHPLGSSVPAKLKGAGDSHGEDAAAAEAAAKEFSDGHGVQELPPPVVLPGVAPATEIPATDDAKDTNVDGGNQAEATDGSSKAESKSQQNSVTKEGEDTGEVTQSGRRKRRKKTATGDDGEEAAETTAQEPREEDESARGRDDSQARNERNGADEGRYRHNEGTRGDDDVSRLRQRDDAYANEQQSKKRQRTRADEGQYENRGRKREDSRNRDDSREVRGSRRDEQRGRRQQSDRDDRNDQRSRRDADRGRREEVDRGRRDDDLSRREEVDRGRRDDDRGGRGEWDRGRRDDGLGRREEWDRGRRDDDRGRGEEWDRGRRDDGLGRREEGDRGRSDGDRGRREEWDRGRRDDDLVRREEVDRRRRNDDPDRSEEVDRRRRDDDRGRGEEVNRGRRDDDRGRRDEVDRRRRDDVIDRVRREDMDLGRRDDDRGLREEVDRGRRDDDFDRREEADRGRKEDQGGRQEDDRGRREYKREQLRRSSHPRDEPGRRFRSRSRDVKKEKAKESDVREGHPSKRGSPTRVAHKSTKWDMAVPDREAQISEAAAAAYVAAKETAASSQQSLTSGILAVMGQGGLSGPMLSSSVPGLPSTSVGPNFSNGAIRNVCIPFLCRDCFDTYCPAWHPSTPAEFQEQVQRFSQKKCVLGKKCFLNTCIYQH